MTLDEVIFRLEAYALFHAEGDQPFSCRTVEALKEAIRILREVKENNECMNIKQ